MTDLQAAIGCAQMGRLQEFNDARRRAWHILREGLAPLAERLLLPEPPPHADPCWFAFLTTVRREAGFTREQLTAFLEQRQIQTRTLFAGNILLHPCFDHMRAQGQGYRVIGDLPNTQRVMEGTFLVGVYPGLTDAMLEYVVQSIHEFCSRT